MSAQPVRNPSHGFRPGPARETHRLWLGPACGVFRSSPPGPVRPWPLYFSLESPARSGPRDFQRFKPGPVRPGPQDYQIVKPGPARPIRFFPPTTWPPGRRPVREDPCCIVQNNGCTLCMCANRVAKKTDLQAISIWRQDAFASSNSPPLSRTLQTPQTSEV